MSTIVLSLTDSQRMQACADLRRMLEHRTEVLALQEQITSEQSAAAVNEAACATGLALVVAQGVNPLIVSVSAVVVAADGIVTLTVAP